MWRLGQPGSLDSPLLESVDDDLSLDAQFGGLSEVVTKVRYKGFLDCILIHHRQKLLDPLVNGFQGGKVGLFGAGVGVVFVGLRGELLYLGRHFVSGDGFQWDAVHLPSDKTSFPRKEDQVTTSLSTSSASSANAVDIDVSCGWDTDLDDSRHSRIIDTSSRDITGH